MAAEVQQRRSSAAGGHRPSEADHQLDGSGSLHVADEPTDSLPTGLARLVEMARALATTPSRAAPRRAELGSQRRGDRGLGGCSGSWRPKAWRVLLVEHDMALVMAICARVDVLDNGAGHRPR